MKKMKLITALLSLMLIAGCNSAPTSTSTISSTPPTSTPTISLTPKTTPSPTPTHAPTPTPKTTSTPESTKTDNKAKETSLGFTTNDFLSKFNTIVSELDSSIYARIGKVLGDIVDINVSDSVSLSLYVEGGYVTTIIVKGSGTGTLTSGKEQMYCMVAAAKAADTSLTTSAASNFILELLDTAPKGKDYTKNKNGLKYTVSAQTGSTWLQIKK